MTGGSHIRAIGPEAAQNAPEQAIEHVSDEPIILQEEWVEEEPEPTMRRRWYDWIVPVSAVLAIAGWTGFYGWAFQDQLLALPSPQGWVPLIVDWSVPVLLIATLWLLSMRLSRREAARFGDAANLLRQESRELEDRLAVVNRELSLAREFLGSQSRELESLGRIASERLSTHASTLQSLIKNNGAQVEAIASVSDTALANIGKLRDDLPVIANSARDVSNQIGQTGRAAQEQLEKLVVGFERLNDFGKASGRQVNALSEQIEATIGRFEGQLTQIEQVTESRFALMAEKSEEFRVELDGREVDALAAMRHRADEFRTSIGALGEQLALDAENGLSALKAQVQTLADEAAKVTASLNDAQENAIAGLDEHKQRLYKDIAEVVARIDQLDLHAVAAGRRRLETFAQETEHLDAQIAARDARFAEAVARRQDEFDTREAQASEVLAQRLTELDEMLAERNEAQAAQLEQLVAHGSSVAAKIQELSGLLSAVAEQSQRTETTLGAGMGDLAERLGQSRSDLTETANTLAELTESGIRLLEIIQSGARETREALPKAIDQAAARLGEVEQRALLLKENVDAAHERGSGLNDYVIAARENVAQTAEDVGALHERVAKQSDESMARIAALRDALGELEQDSERVSARTGEDLRKAIVQLEEAARHAFAALESGSDEKLAEVAEQIGARASAAIERSLQAEGAAAVERLEEASLRASTAGKDIAANLRDQLAKVNELAANLEQRVVRARELAQEQVDNDFARRMALITESLNSNAIDIAKALSADVADTAWASYLKGDRGIFTRRAVRLVDNSEAREIMELYESDQAFREHVSRYIHDFESMLRSVLSTRDGNALGVTLLSSDMGKLYVALAQAIERLRD
ncbi:ATPase [Altererythrobacter litoralis]|uniref:ATPase n=1 Tax=Altererythrobacter litoralis TaxID=3113904 RepID=A0ABU7GB70_9SPHN|nr:ATPase [Erythrobacteraceae bacterium 1XM1-14]